MKKLLQQMLEGADLQVGDWYIYAWNDGSGLISRQDKTGLLGAEDEPTVAGLSRILEWIDNQ
jgi:hypothetical protein